MGQTHDEITQNLAERLCWQVASLIEHGCIKAAKQQWDLGHPPQKNDRAVRVHVVFPLLMFALATAYRQQCEREALRGEPVGWQRWRRQLLEQTRDHVIVFAQGYYGIFHITEFALLMGSNSSMCPQRSARARKSWPNIVSQQSADSYVGTSGHMC